VERGPAKHLIAILVGAHLLLVLQAAAGGPFNSRNPTKPSDYYGVCCGVVQRWFMFQGVAPNSSRLEVSIDVEGEWRDVYIERSPELDWNASLFDHYRWREYINHLRTRTMHMDWDPFVAWVSTEALADHADADAVRVRIMRATIPGPEQLKSHGLPYRATIREATVDRGAP
jgi:hypothetical protein